MTTSTGLLGLPDNLAYATAKAALVGMTRHMRIVGAPHDIKVNLIAPAAVTRMAGGASQANSDAPPPERPEMAPELVAPMVAFLAHETCPVSGEIYTGVPVASRGSSSPRRRATSSRTRQQQSRTSPSIGQR